MSTTGRNNIVAGCVHQEGFLVHGHIPVSDSGSHINQGDLVYWDSSSHTAKALDTDGHAATLLGIALGPSKATSNLDNSSSVSEPTINVGYGVIANLLGTAGDTYHDGDVVYYGTDAQTITAVVGTNKVGVVRLPPEGAAIVGAAGVTVPVLVYSNAFVKFNS